MVFAVTCNKLLPFLLHTAVPDQSWVFRKQGSKSPWGAGETQPNSPSQGIKIFCWEYYLAAQKPQNSHLFIPKIPPQIYGQAKAVYFRDRRTCRAMGKWRKDKFPAKRIF